MLEKSAPTPRRHSTRKSVFIASLMLGLSVISLSAPMGAMAQEEVGVNAVIQNPEAVAIADFEAKSRPVAEGMSALLNDTITSGEGAKVQILLKDEKTITVGQNCEFTIDEFTYNPATDGYDMAANIAKGTFRFMSGKPSSSNRTTLRTPVASMGVRGTIVEGAVGPRAVSIAGASVDLSKQTNINWDEATLIVLRGPSDDAQGIDNEGAVDVLPGGAASQTSLESGPKLASLDAAAMANLLPMAVTANMTSAQDKEQNDDTPDGAPLLVQSGDKMVPLRQANVGVFIPYKGGPIIGPFYLSNRSFEELSDDLRTKPFGDAPFEAPFEIRTPRDSGDTQNDGEYGFPWEEEDSVLDDRPDIDDGQGFPNGPPFCPPTLPGCP